MEAPQPRSHVALLALLVLSAITGVYLFFQSAPEAQLYVDQLSLTHFLRYNAIMTLWPVAHFSQPRVRAHFRVIRNPRRVAHLAKWAQRQNGHCRGPLAVCQSVPRAPRRLRAQQLLHRVHRTADLRHPGAHRAEHPVRGHVPICTGPNFGRFLRHDGRLAVLHAFLFPGPWGL